MDSPLSPTQTQITELLRSTYLFEIVPDSTKFVVVFKLISLEKSFSALWSDALRQFIGIIDPAILADFLLWFYEQDPDVPLPNRTGFPSPELFIEFEKSIQEQARLDGSSASIQPLSPVDASVVALEDITVAHFLDLSGVQLSFPTLPAGMSCFDALCALLASGANQLPVWNADLATPLSFVNVWSLTAMLMQSLRGDIPDLRRTIVADLKLIDPSAATADAPFCIPANMPLVQALSELRRRRIQCAPVVDAETGAYETYFSLDIHVPLLIHQASGRSPLVSGVNEPSVASPIDMDAPIRSVLVMLGILPRTSRKDAEKQQQQLLAQQQAAAQNAQTTTASPAGAAAVGADGKPIPPVDAATAPPTHPLQSLRDREEAALRHKEAIIQALLFGPSLHDPIPAAPPLVSSLPQPGPGVVLPPGEPSTVTPFGAHPFVDLLPVLIDTVACTPGLDGMVNAARVFDHQHHHHHNHSYPLAHVGGSHLMAASAPPAPLHSPNEFLKLNPLGDLTSPTNPAAQQPGAAPAATGPGLPPTSPGAPSAAAIAAANHARRMSTGGVPIAPTASMPPPAPASTAQKALLSGASVPCEVFGEDLPLHDALLHLLLSDARRLVMCDPVTRKPVAILTPSDIGKFFVGWTTQLPAGDANEETETANANRAGANDSLEQSPQSANLDGQGEDSRQWAHDHNVGHWGV